MPDLAVIFQYSIQTARGEQPVLLAGRLIFRGYLPISSPGGVCGWLYQQGVGASAFKTFAPQLAERLLQHAKQTAQAAGRPYRYLATRQSKEELARQIAVDDGINQGLVGVFSCLETCRTFRLRYGPGRPQLTSDLRRCTVLSYFWMDAEQAFCMILDA